MGGPLRKGGGQFCSEMVLSYIEGRVGLCDGGERQTAEEAPLVK